MTPGKFADRYILRIKRTGRPDERSEDRCWKGVRPIPAIVVSNQLKWFVLLLLIHLAGQPFICVSGGAEAAGQIGVVTASNLNMRSGPGSHHPPLMKLQPGTRVNILGRENLWLRISYQGQIGYIRNNSKYIDIVSADETEPVPGASDRDLDDSGDDRIDQLKHKAATISAEIQKSEARVLDYKKEEAVVSSRLNDIDLRLNSGRRRLRVLKAEMAALDQRIAQNDQSIKTLENKIRASEDYAAKRLVALYKLTWFGEIPALASAETIYELVQRKSNLERILSYDETVLKELTDNKKELQARLHEIQVQKGKKSNVQEQLDRHIQSMTEEKGNRTQLLQEIRNQRSLEIAAIEALKKSAQNLDEKIRLLTVQPEEAPTFAAGAKAFPELKGLLNMPVRGKIISFFGPHKNSDLNVVNYQSGINIKAERGEPIQAVHAGRVLFADWFKGYGNMIIIDHGDHYYTIYAHAEEVFKTKGEMVEPGEVIATVGDSGSMIGPALHFEVRHHGKPEDPLNWLKKG
jgi:septal ring factor EnvC (AmiA/AmiB activator)